mgnify:CR=1 FL=1
MLHLYALPLRVRYADSDAQGHVFFANYLTYADEGVTGYLAEVGVPLAKLESAGLDIVYAATSCQHRGSAHVGDLLMVHTTISRFGRTSLTADVQVCLEDRVLAEVELTIVVVSRHALEPTPVPVALKEAVTRYEGADASRA